MNVQTQLPTTVRERMKTIAMPVVYEDACKALVACTTLDEAKYYSDKSDALAAWAKIYKSDEAAMAAKRLKLHAYRRMSELAEEIAATLSSRPKSAGKAPCIVAGCDSISVARGLCVKHHARWCNGDSTINPLEKVHVGLEKGGKSVLKDFGFSNNDAENIRTVGLLPKANFDQIITSPAVPSMRQILRLRSGATKAWSAFSRDATSVFRWFSRRHSAKQLARDMSPDEAASARKIARELADWLDEFEQHLPKDSPQ